MSMRKRLERLENANLPAAGPEGDDCRCRRCGKWLVDRLRASIQSRLWDFRLLPVAEQERQVAPNEAGGAVGDEGGEAIAANECSRWRAGKKI